MKSLSQAATDVGRHRTNNEDAFFADDALGLYAVADGVGGNAAGEVASQLFVDTVKAAGPRLQELLRAAAGRPDLQRDVFLGFINDIFQRACELIFNESKDDVRKRGMASTGVIIALADGYAMIGHVGDSRAYLIRGGTAKQLTNDHTVGQELVDSGVLKPELLATFPYRSVLSRALGTMPHCKVDTLFLDARPSDRFVLCSDGFAQYFTLTDLGTMAKVKVADAIHVANEAGGSDNLTAVFADVSGPRRHTQSIDTDARIRTLAGLFMFRELNAQELMRTLKIVHEQVVAEGAPLVREGDAGDRFFVVVEGKLEVTKQGVVLAELEPGSHFGELAFMDARPRSADVMARTAATVLWIGRDDFLALTREDPALATKLLRSFVMTLSERLRSTSEEFAKGKR